MAHQRPALCEPRSYWYPDATSESVLYEPYDTREMAEAAERFAHEEKAAKLDELYRDAEASI